MNVPFKAASRLNGSEDVPREAKGGSTRPNGAETRRVLFMLAILRLGERPAGAVNGARGDDMLDLAGVLRRDGMVGGGGIDLEGVMVNVKGLNGFSETSLLLFFEGELKMAGSTFSLFFSSYTVGSKGRLVGEKRLFVKDALAFPFVIGDF